MEAMGFSTIAFVFSSPQSNHLSPYQIKFLYTCSGLIILAGNPLPVHATGQGLVALAGSNSRA